METTTIKTTVFRRFSRRIHLFGSSGSIQRSFPSRIPARLSSDDGGRLSSGVRQEMNVDMVRISAIKERDKVKEWAYKNAYMLIFLSGMFFLTWVLFVLYAEGWIGKK